MAVHIKLIKNNIKSSSSYGKYFAKTVSQKFQQEYNRSMLQKAELVKCRRTESIINEEFGFLMRNGQRRLIISSSYTPMKRSIRQRYRGFG